MNFLATEFTEKVFYKCHIYYTFLSPATEVTYKVLYTCSNVNKNSLIQMSYTNQFLCSCVQLKE